MIILWVRNQDSRQIQDGGHHIDGRHLGFGDHLGFLKSQDISLFRIQSYPGKQHISSKPLSNILIITYSHNNTTGSHI